MSEIIDVLEIIVILPRKIIGTDFIGNTLCVHIHGPWLPERFI